MYYTGNLKMNYLPWRSRYNGEKEKIVCKPGIIIQGEPCFEGSKLESTFTFGKLKIQSSLQVIVLLRLRLLICTMGMIENRRTPARAWPSLVQCDKYPTGTLK